QLIAVVLRVAELTAPDGGVDRTRIDTDPAVHAERVIHREAIEDLRGASATSAGGLVRLLVGVDVDAPVGALARALVADRAVLLLERDHAARPGRKVGSDVGVLHGHRAAQHGAERDGKTLDE